jgi:hypothetical protein
MLTAKLQHLRRSQFPIPNKRLKSLEIRGSPKSVIIRTIPNEQGFPSVGSPYKTVEILKINELSKIGSLGRVESL